MWFSNLEGKTHSHGLRAIRHNIVSVFNVSRPSKRILGASALLSSVVERGERERAQRGAPKGSSAIKQAFESQLKQVPKSF